MVGDHFYASPRRTRPVWIAEEEAFGDEVCPKEIAVEVVVNAAEIVLRHAPLTATTGGRLDELAILEPITDRVVRRVNPVVERPCGRVGHVLGLSVSRPVVVVHDLFDVGYAVAIGVLHKE